MVTVTELKKEFARLALQLESTEAQEKNTFNPEERKELRDKIKFIKEKIDCILDQYNFQQKFGQTDLTNS